MKKYIFATALLSAFGAGATYGAWDVISTFDDASALDRITDVTNIEGSNARSEIVDGKWAAYPGDLFELNSNLYALFDLGMDIKAASVNSGGPVTVYLEVTQPTVDDGAGGTRKAIVDTVWGLSNYPAEEVLETRYNSYNAMQRINVGNDNFEGRNGSSYEAVDILTADTTYKMWLVIDYNLNYYEAYVQGGQWTEQTRLGTAETEGFWLFRVNPAAEDTVESILVALSRGNTVDGEKGVDPTYFDNIAVDVAGQNLTTPPVGGGGDTWLGFEVLPGGDANTEDWLGWVNVTYDPYIFSYSLNQWLYIDGSGVGAGGGWVYIFNF